MPKFEHNKKDENLSQKGKNNYNRRLFIRSVGLAGLGMGLIPKLFAQYENPISKIGSMSTGSGKLPLNLKHYYAHEAVLDRYGVIAPWYQQQNGQCDFRIRIAAETLKRYPWTTTENAVEAYPHYVFSSKWSISSEGEITPKDPGDWMNGDLGQRTTSVIKGMVEYYRYSGDPASIAHLTYMANFVLDYCLTPADHSWPNFPISVPTLGKAYGIADPAGMIQLDICATMGDSLLKAYQLTKNKKWFDAAKHWGDLFAEKCNLSPNAAPWPRYANPEDIAEKTIYNNYTLTKEDPRANLQTGGVTMILTFLDELIRLGYSGKNLQIVTARDAGIRYLRDELLPKWYLDQTWGFYFWDWLNETQNCSTTADVALYLIKNKEKFPNWRNDTRNILTLFLNRSSADEKSGSNVFNGAWAYPESSSCCGKSFWYAPLMVGAVMAQYGEVADDPIMRELAYRQFILQTYDILESGVTEDNIEGGVIVNGDWFNIAHPWPLLWVQRAIGCLPEELGASRENHLVRSSSIVDSIIYGKDIITYSTFDALSEAIDVFRLSYTPTQISADGEKLLLRNDLMQNGYTIKKLPNGDAIVSIRHDGKKRIILRGADPQKEIKNTELQYEGRWKKLKDNASVSGSIRWTDTKDASFTTVFHGNQIRLKGRVDQFGGQADVFIDGIKQIIFIDFWNPSMRGEQILYYKNGLSPGKHTLKIVARGSSNPYAKGNRVYIDSVQFSSESDVSNFPEGTGPTGPQRMVFGYTKRQDYKDTGGKVWWPGTEVVTRLYSYGDTVAQCWIPETNNIITGTPDQELYRYGIQSDDFWVNVTVGPGKYGVRLKFAAAEGAATYRHDVGFDIIINEKTVVQNFNVIGTAKGTNKAVDLIFKDITPLNGIVQIRFKGLPYLKSKKQTVAFVQALEIDQNLTGEGATPVSFNKK